MCPLLVSFPFFAVSRDECLERRHALSALNAAVPEGTPGGVGDFACEDRPVLSPIWKAISTKQLCASSRASRKEERSGGAGNSRIWTPRSLPS